MSSWFDITEYKLQGKWVAKDKEATEFSDKNTYIEVEGDSAPKVSYTAMGEEYYPQTLRSWDEEQLHWEIEDEIFTLHVLGGPGKLEHPYQKYVTIENSKTKSIKRYKLVEITEEEYEDHREWYKSVEDKIWCQDSQWESLPTKDRIDNDDVTTLPTDENGFIIKDASLFGYDESIGGSIVNVPDGIKRIKSCAFSNCKGIMHVHIPDSVRSIGDGCFGGCENLVCVRLPEGLTNIGDKMFQGCANLQEINLPNTIASIGRDSFADCKSLVEVVMPETLTVIGDRSFHGAIKLKKIVLNSNLEKIEFAAFGNCNTLAELYIPASVTTIETQAFLGCSSLESIIVEDDNEKYFSKNNCLIERENKALILACNNSVIPADGGVKRIGDNAFSNCKKIEHIILPETIEGIGYYAFEGCSSLRDIQLPKSLPEGYGNGLFADCSSLERFEMPNWMTKFPIRMFGGCESLIELKIPDYVTEIGVCAFEGCKLLTELVIPKSVQLIDASFIRGCTSLKRLEIEVGNPIYHSRDNCIIETKTGKLLAILENGVIPTDGSVTKIGEWAFCACEKMQEISLPECITTIGNMAFSNLSNLKKINIPKSVISIESSAFLNNHGEKIYDAVEEENGVYYVGNWALGIVRKKVEQTDSVDTNSLFVSKSEEVLPASGAITIREGTVGICASAFSCDNLRSISIPKSVEIIGDHAFYACSDLEYIILPEGLIGIGESAFGDCDKLQSITIPHTVKSIGERAFSCCKGLQTLVIPEVEIDIGKDAFAYCGDIPNIDVPTYVFFTQFNHLGSVYNEDEGGYVVASEDYDGEEDKDDFFVPVNSIDDDEPIPDFLDLDELNAEITSELFEEIDDGDLPF